MSDFTDRSQFRVGDLLVVPDMNMVMRGEEEIKLEPRMMEVLVELAHNANNIVSKDALLDEFWSDEEGNQTSDENPVTKTISILRKRIGDDKRKPRYIKTISGKGYCMIASVQFAEGYRHNHRDFGRWTHGNPYVGLKPFDVKYAEVFHGRSGTVAALLSSIREQIDNQRRFVLIIGSSGCGKTSLVRAALIPTLTRSGGAEGLRAISVATCDLGTTDDGDVMATLAAALYSWSLGGQSVFAFFAIEDLKKTLINTPEKISIILENGFRRYPQRGIESQPHAHFFLTIDHAEVLVANRDITNEQKRAFARVLRELCDTPRTMTVMISRWDFYHSLAEALPELAENRSGLGHFEVSMPNEGELAKIIRKPAALAGVDFEEHPKTQVFLDDLLCRKALAQPDALPLLQHTLHSLYERCNGTGLLTYTAYEEIGGLEGAIARRAEQVFGELPAAIQKSLERILPQLVGIQPDSGAVSASPIPRSKLSPDADLLVSAFIDARLFISELNSGHPFVSVSHEALLRNWPRVADWIEENKRLLQAKERVKRAAKRWGEGGRKDDHLLNSGRPLGEAQEVLSRMPEDLENEVRDFISSSIREEKNQRAIRRILISALAIFSVTSLTFGMAAGAARREAEARQMEAERANTLMLDEIASNIEHVGDLQLLKKIASNAISIYRERPFKSLSQDDLVNFSRALRIQGSVKMKKGQFDSSILDFQEAEFMSASAVILKPKSAYALREFAQTSFWLGFHNRNHKDYNKAEEHWINYLHRARLARSISPYDPALLMEESYAHNNLATLADDNGEPEKSWAHLQISLSLKKRALAILDREDWQKDLADTESWIGMTLETLGHLDSASSFFSSAIARLKPIAEEHPENREWALQLIKFRQLNARLQLSRGLNQAAIASIEDAILDQNRIFGKNRTNNEWNYGLAHSYQIAGDCERILRNKSAAANYYAMALHTIGSNSGTEIDPREQRLRVLIEIGNIRLQGSESTKKRVMDVADSLNRLHLETPTDIHTSITLAEVMLLSGDALNAQGSHQEARKQWKRILTLQSGIPRQASSPKMIAIRTIAEARLGNRAATADGIKRLETIGYRHQDFASSLKLIPAR